MINYLHILNLVTLVALPTDFSLENQVAELINIYFLSNLQNYYAEDKVLFGDKHCLLTESYEFQVRKTTDGYKMRKSQSRKGLCLRLTGI